MHFTTGRNAPVRFPRSERNKLDVLMYGLDCVLMLMFGR